MSIDTTVLDNKELADWLMRSGHRDCPNLGGNKITGSIKVRPHLLFIKVWFIFKIQNTIYFYWHEAKVIVPWLNTHKISKQTVSGDWEFFRTLISLWSRFQLDIANWILFCKMSIVHGAPLVPWYQLCTYLKTI